MKNTRFVIACGGTGGHFYPGFALGKALSMQGKEVLFVVRQNDPAIATLQENNLPYEQINLTGLPRSVNPLLQIRFVKKLMGAFRQARQILQRVKPHVVLGMGGYVSFPVIFCAHRLGIKTAVHESNTIWGLSNRICAHFADLRLMGLPMRKTYKNSVLTSTPIREQFAQEVSREEVLTGLGLNSQGAVALIMGGSQGAKGLNEALPGLIKQFPQWQFIHLTGRNWYEKQQALYQGLPNVKTLAYSEEVYKLMKAADCMICRSGASTLAEVIACKIPAILVPFPYAAANHQYVNAQVLADAGCAQLVPEGKQFAQRLAQALSELSPQRLTQMRGAYEKLTIPSALSATNTISHLLENL